jgi:hypothetical protein
MYFVAYDKYRKSDSLALSPGWLNRAFSSSCALGSGLEPSVCPVMDEN